MLDFRSFFSVYSSCPSIHEQKLDGRKPPPPLLGIVCLPGHKVLKKVLLDRQGRSKQEHCKDHRDVYRGLAGIPLPGGDLESVLAMASQQLKAHVDRISIDKVNIEILQIGSMCVFHTSCVRGHVTIPHCILFWHVDGYKATHQSYCIRSERNC